MLAHVSDDELALVFDTADVGTLGVPIGRSRDELLTELALIRQQGYAQSFGEVVEGASALAAPILDGLGRPRAAINITGPETRFGTDAMEPLIARLLEAVHDIEAQSGFAS
jgi:DNA-binding IclR family transcriptional regulator